MNGLLNLVLQKLVKEMNAVCANCRPEPLQQINVHRIFFASGQHRFVCYSSHPRKQRSTLTAASAAF